MGTRGIILTPVEEVQDISDVNDDTECKCIEMFQDSYPSNVLEKLDAFVKQYTVEVIMMGGNISSLKPLYEPNELGFHDKEHPQSDVTLVIERDVRKSIENQFQLVTLKERKNRYPNHDYVYFVNNEEVYFDTNLNATLDLKHISEYTEDWEDEE